MKKIILATCVVFSVALTGCASITMADPKKDAAAKQFKAPENGNAGIYIYRNESFGGAVPMDVEIDSKTIGTTMAKSYLYKEVAPGKHAITSKSENTHTIEIEAKPGILHYIWQEVKMGMQYARTKLHLVNEEQGKKGVLESKLAETE